MSHLEKELTDAAVEDNKKQRLRLVLIACIDVSCSGRCTEMNFVGLSAAGLG